MIREYAHSSLVIKNYLFDIQSLSVVRTRAHRMATLIRSILIIGGGLMVVLAAGYFFQLPWATATWFWPEGGVLSHAFIAAMQAAIAAAMLWIGISGELGAIAAGTLNLTVMLVGVAVLLIRLIEPSEHYYLMDYAIGCALFALFNLLFFVWSSGLPIRDQRRTPMPIRLSYVLFILVLAGVGVALILRIPNILPWKVEPHEETRIIFGWMFLGDAFYFLYALLRPQWNNARAQLWSFLAYDLVLLGPFGMRLLKIAGLPIDQLLGYEVKLPPSELWPNLLVYTLVLLYSAGLGIYYLLINAQTRPNHLGTPDQVAR